MEQLNSETLQVTVVQERDGFWTVVLRGEIDASETAAADLVAALLATQPQQITFDLQGVSFMDSSGLALLLRSASSTRVLLRRPSPGVLRLLDATGLANHFPIKT